MRRNKLRVWEKTNKSTGKKNEIYNQLHRHHTESESAFGTILQHIYKEFLRIDVSHTIQQYPVRDKSRWVYIFFPCLFVSFVFSGNYSSNGYIDRLFHLYFVRHSWGRGIQVWLKMISIHRLIKIILSKMENISFYLIDNLYHGIAPFTCVIILNLDQSNYYLVHLSV